ncbi:MAG: TylF/MycF/NovP-related O-methyltransferase, partial [Gaiellaceae bacterium]
MSGERNLAADNERLDREVRELRARVSAYETSRWWRLHPRFLLQRSARAAAAGGSDDGVRMASFPPDFEERDRELCARVQPYTMTTPSRIYALARAVDYVVEHRIPGALVECGVWKGGSMMAVALTLLRRGVTDRELYLYDTFAGMTEPGDEDVRHTGERAADLLAEMSSRSHVWALAGLEEVRENVLGVGY